jgi:TDG/mug DNA glycosylase family protein
MSRAYVLPDLLGPGLKIVFCGSAVGAASARAGAPYAKPGNKFWPTLHAAGFTSRLVAPADWREILALGLGLTDLNKVEFGNDTDISPEGDDVAALRTKIERYRPRCLAFTAKRPARVFLGHAVAYGPQPERVGDTALYVLPSPSGRAGSFWDASHWRALARQYAC